MKKLKDIPFDELYAMYLFARKESDCYKEGNWKDRYLIWEDACGVILREIKLRMKNIFPKLPRD